MTCPICEVDNDEQLTFLDSSAKQRVHNLSFYQDGELVILRNAEVLTLNYSCVFGHKWSQDVFIKNEEEKEIDR